MDVSRFRFDDGADFGDGHIEMYFIMPKEMLEDVRTEHGLNDKFFENAVHGELKISIEKDGGTCVSISPTIETDPDYFEDTDWTDIDISDSEKETLMNMAGGDISKQLKDEGFEPEDIEHINAMVACGFTLDSAMQSLL